MPLFGERSKSDISVPQSKEPAIPKVPIDLDKTKDTKESGKGGISRRRFLSALTSIGTAAAVGTMLVKDKPSSETEAIKPAHGSQEESFDTLKPPILISPPTPVRTIRHTESFLEMPKYETFRSETLPEITIGNSGEYIYKSPTESNLEAFQIPDDLNIEALKANSFMVSDDGRVHLVSFEGVILLIEENPFDEILSPFQFHENDIVPIYEMMGFSLPKSKIYQNGKYRVSEYLVGRDIPNNPSSVEYKYCLQELRKRFVLDSFFRPEVISDDTFSNLRLGLKGEVTHITPSNSTLWYEFGKSYQVSDFEKFLWQGLHKSIYSGIPTTETQSQCLKLIEKYPNIREYYLKLPITHFGTVSKEEVIKHLDRRYEQLVDFTFNFTSYILSEFTKNSEIYPTESSYSPAHKLYEFVVNNEYFYNKYISKTTRDYLLELDNPDIELDSNVKEAIRRNIVIHEILYKKTYEDLASKCGLSVEEYKILLQNKVNSLVSESDYFRATSLIDFQSILDAGRFMSQFETRKSSGLYFPHLRSIVESYYFAFPSSEILNSFRPIYGYISSQKNGNISSLSDKFYMDQTRHFGTIKVKFNKRVQKKSTILFGDSLVELGHYFSETFNGLLTEFGYSVSFQTIATPMVAPHFSSLGVKLLEDLYSKSLYSSEDDYINLINRIDSSLTNTFFRHYVEAQYHNQLLVSDIEEIIIDREDMEAMDSIPRVVEEYNLKNPKSPIKLKITNRFEVE